MVDWAWLGQLGGFIGVSLLAASIYHNYRVREYARRQAEALENLLEEIVGRRP